MAKLTPKQERFAAEYLVDLNATAAAARAGYKDPNFGRQLLTKPNVAEAIQKAKAERQARTEISQDRVVEELADIAFKDADDAPESSLKVSNKLKALELLGKHLGMFNERADVKVEASVEVVPLSQRRELLREIAQRFAEEDGHGG